MSEKEPFSKLCVLCKLFASDTFQSREDSASRIARWREKKFITPKTARAGFLLSRPVARAIIQARKYFDEKILD